MEGRGCLVIGGKESMWWMRGISRAYLRRDSQEGQVKMKTKVIHSVARQRSMNQAFLQSSTRLGRGGGSVIGKDVGRSADHTSQMLRRPRIDSL